MPASPHFIRIKGQILHIVDRIPKGRVVTSAAIGERLEVPARHVAYILATLEDMERDAHPWHRVVGKDGKIGKHLRAADQIARLTRDGVGVTAAGIIRNPDGVVIDVPQAWVVGPTRPDLG